MTERARPHISIDAVTERIRSLHLPDVDAVVAIERGGLAPGTIVAAELDRPLGRFRLSYRDDHNDPLFEEPQLVGGLDVPVPPGGHLLVVDDVSVTGSTLRTAAQELKDFRTTTLVLKGEADFVAFPELETCVKWPWPQQPDVSGAALDTA